VLRANLEPRLVRAIRDRRLLDGSPLVVVDVGARGGAADHWTSFGDQALVIGFDPDRDEVGRLNAGGAADGDATRTYIGAALGRRRERRQFWRSEFGPGGSLYRLDELFAEVRNGENVQLLSSGELETVDLDSAMREHGFDAIDFAKLDVEGAEADVLDGAESLLASPRLLGLELEVHFQKRPQESACFAEIDARLRERGFELYDLDVYRYDRRALPMPMLYDYRDGGRPIPGPAVEGQVLTGDALYFRPPATLPEGALTVLKLAALLDVYTLRDCAAAAVLAHADTLPASTPAAGLLDLLTPQVDGGTVSYEDYLQHAERFDAAEGRIFGPNLQLLDWLWRALKPEPTNEAIAELAARLEATRQAPAGGLVGRLRRSRRPRP
jgi:FkbM family methyltransferase